ncbi:hypothetical protein SNEBB_007724, partial [Seison nebaliae]
MNKTNKEKSKKAVTTKVSSNVKHSVNPKGKRSFAIPFLGEDTSETIKGR